MIKLNRLCAVLLTFAVCRVMHGQDDAQSQSTVGDKPLMTTLRERQLDVSYDVRNIERALTRLKKVSELSKTRITEAAKAAESVSLALDRNDLKQAKGDARQATELFNEVAKLLEALLAQDTPERVAIARDLASQLANDERQFAKQLQDDMSEKERREALAARAEQLARTGKTLEDILKSLTESADAADKEAIATIEAALKETDLLKMIGTLSDTAEMIRTGKLDDARLVSLDVGDRLEITAQRLGKAYRSTIAPRADELLKLETDLTKLRDKLDKLETQGQIGAWHREATEIVDRADKLGIGGKVRDEFLELMKKSRTVTAGAQATYQWDMVDERYLAPDAYQLLLARIQEQLQLRIQSLLLGDFTASDDQNTPPKYQEMVDRYYQVLSRGSSDKKNHVRNVEQKMDQRMKSK